MQKPNKYTNKPYPLSDARRERNKHRALFNHEGTGRNPGATHTLLMDRKRIVDLREARRERSA